jgi:hypothetical protein
MNTVRVVKAYKTKFTDPLIAHAGESVAVGKRDDKWPGWVWCTNNSGKASWVHESFIDIHEGRAIFREDYSAQELDVKVGDMLTMLRETGGWFWCKTSRGIFGWIPAEVAVILD